jgi:hypothetical protein
MYGRFHLRDINFTSNAIVVSTRETDAIEGKRNESALGHSTAYTCGGNRRGGGGVVAKKTPSIFQY